MAKFSLGDVVMTRGVASTIPSNIVFDALKRHRNGDWGDVCAEDKKSNDEAVKYEGNPDKQDRVLSVYYSNDGTKFWIITEWDRSYTTVLLPDEY